MPLKDKELREAVRLGIKTLIIQEVRLLRLEQAFTPHIVTDEMKQRSNHQVVASHIRKRENSFAEENDLPNHPRAVPWYAGLIWTGSNNRSHIPV